MQSKEELPDAIGAVSITGGFWGRVLERNRTATLPHVLAQCEAEGDVRNLEIAAVPYYAWNNREPGKMRVWIARG